MATQRVQFPAEGENAPMLHGEMGTPDFEGTFPGVVVAHPHPQRGGSMNNSVVIALCQGLKAAGMAYLRFNFRGVGRSQGEFDNGEGEQLDVRGALNFLATQPQIDPERIGLAGYSFGARVSLAAVLGAPQVKALLCVAPPVQEPLPADRQPTCPLQVLIGSQDPILAGDPERYASYFPDPQVVKVVEGPDHFWLGFGHDLSNAIDSFFLERLAPPGGLRVG
jgi:uncharacterized protein